MLVFGVFIYFFLMRMFSRKYWDLMMIVDYELDIYVGLGI